MPSSADKKKTPDSPAATRTALSHPHSKLFTEGRTGQAFYQLATRPAGKLSGAPCISRDDAQVSHRSRPRGGDGGHQPVRFFSRTSRRVLSFRVRTLAASRTRAVLWCGAVDAALRALLGCNFAPEDAQRPIPCRAQP